jgi:hypothetical protein
VIFRKSGEVNKNGLFENSGLKFDIVLKNKAHEISQTKYLMPIAFLIFFMPFLRKLYGQSGKC